MSRLVIVFLVYALSFGVLAQAKTYKAGLGNPKAAKIKIYQGKALEQSFEVIGKITVTAKKKKDLHENMKRKAALLKGDAVLMYGNLENESQFLISGFSVQGVVVRFKSEADGGIKEISETTVVPVLN